MSTFPVLSIRLAIPRLDGDLDHDVLATAAGVPESARGELFDLLCAELRRRGYPTGGLSLTVADSIECAPCRVVDMVVRLAGKLAGELRRAA